MSRKHHPRPEWIRSLDLFSSCSPRQMEQIDSLAASVRVKAGRELTREGRPVAEFVVVLDGTATVASDGYQIDRFGPGSFFGDAAVLDRAHSAVSVTADTDMDLLVFSPQQYRDMREALPGVSGMRTSRIERPLPGLASRQLGVRIGLLAGQSVA